MKLTGFDPAKGFGTATPTFGPSVVLPSQPERVRGDGSGQTRKYNNRKVELDGYTFDSKKESRRYLDLRALRDGRVIDDLQVHPVFPLLGLDRAEVYRYTADFAYYFVGVRQRIVEDCKSVATRKKDTWRIIKKLFRSTYGFDIQER